MHEYHRLLRKVLEHGSYREDRTGVGAYSVFGEQSRYDLSAGFPLVTTKKCHLRSIIHELLWFIKGDTNIRYLRDNNVTIWDEWADPKGDLGPVYGAQWRQWSRTKPSPNESKSGYQPNQLLLFDLSEFQSDDYAQNPGHRWRKGGKNNSVDQISNVIHDIKTKPYSRRHIVSAWNVARIDEMALPPCHCLFQFFVENGKLSCQLYQRSADIFLGVPFNIASYALLTMMMAQVCELQPGDFVHTFGDLHLYSNHKNQALEQLSREPRPLPTMKINPEVKDIDGFCFEDFSLENYDPWPAIKAPIAV